MDLVWLENTSKAAVMVDGKWLEAGGCRQLSRKMAAAKIERQGKESALVIVDAPTNEPANFAPSPADQHVGNYQGPHR